MGRRRWVRTGPRQKNIEHLLKLGLIDVEEAQNSPLRCVLTRSLGNDPVIRVDFHNVNLAPGDLVVQCCDGLYSFVTEAEIKEAIRKHPLQEACRTLEKAAKDFRLAFQREGTRLAEAQSFLVNAQTDLQTSIMRLENSLATMLAKEEHK